MRFSIRDLLWATALVAMGLGWWLSYEAIDAKRLEAVGQAGRQRSTLLKAQQGNDLALRMVGQNNFNLGPHYPLYVDWRVLDEPLVEP